MCRKLKELNGKTPAELLETSRQTGVFPVDVAQICYKMGIRLVPFDFNQLNTEDEADKLTKSKDEILGAIITNEDDLAILYKADDPVNNRRFTIAHEIAHSCLHMEPDRKFHIQFMTESPDELDEQETLRELQADRFARQLLVPADSLRKVIGDSVRVKPKAVSTLATLFMVSEDVMCKRLQELEISIVDPSAMRIAMN